MYAFPSSWKSEIRKSRKRWHVIKSLNIEGLFRANRATSFTYDTLRKSVAIQPSKVQPKWNKHFPSPVEDKTTYCSCKPETIEHLFRYCDRIFRLYSALTNWIREVTKIEVQFSLESVHLGYTNFFLVKMQLTVLF